MASVVVRWNDAIQFARSGDVLLVDIREEHRRIGRQPSEARHIPLGILLGSPELVPTTAPVVLFGDEERLAEFGARYLRHLGYLASTTPGPDAGD